MSRYVEVEIDLEDFGDDELISELEARGYKIDTEADGESDDLIDKIYHARRQGKPYDHLLDEYLYIMNGRAV